MQPEYHEKLLKIGPDSAKKRNEPSTCTNVTNLSTQNLFTRNDNGTDSPGSHYTVWDNIGGRFVKIFEGLFLLLRKRPVGQCKFSKTSLYFLQFD